MEDKTTTFGVHPERLAKLLEVGLGNDASEESTPEEKKAELLQTKLAGILPLTQDVIDKLPSILLSISKELLPLGGKSLGEVLLDSDTGLDVLENIRNSAKEMSKHHDSEIKRSVSIAIYYTAIASALLFHNKKITSYSYSQLAESFNMLTEKNWLVPELTRHFSMASNFCKNK